MLLECICDCDYFLQFSLICQHIFAVFSVMQVKRIGRSYKQFHRWLRKEDSDDYFADHINVVNPYLIKMTERERKGFA